MCAEEEEERVVSLAHGRGVESAASTSTRRFTLHDGTIVQIVDIIILITP